MQRRRPAPGATRRKTADDHDFLPTGNVFGSPRQLRHAASFYPRCPCSQSSPSISFSFFSLFFHRFNLGSIFSLYRFIINFKINFFRCSSSKTNPVYGRRVNSLLLVCSLSSHRYSYILFIFGSRFIDS
jgi:hypothetical protein